MASSVPPQRILLPNQPIAQTLEEAKGAGLTPTDPFGDHATLSAVRDAMCDGLTLSEATEDWRDRLDAWNRRGQTVALWGSPERAAAFLALVDMGCPIDALVAPTPGFLAPHGVPVVGAQRLVEDPPDVVVSMGPDDTRSVRQQLEAHGIAARVYELA